MLLRSRKNDQESGRTSHGPHKTELEIIFEEKNQAVEYCSTGEQKALLLSITMAASRLHALSHERLSLLLLDEVIAHLDEKRRTTVIQEICALGIQAWVTGTERKKFFGLWSSGALF